MSNCQVGYNQLKKKFEGYILYDCKNLSLLLALLEKVSVLTYKASIEDDKAIYYKSQDLSCDIKDYIKERFDHE